MYDIIGKRKIWFGFSGLLSIVAIIFLSLWGLKLGIDFTGGSILEISYSQARPSMEQISESLADLDINSLKLQPSGEHDYIIRFEEIDESTHQAINTSLSTIKIEGVEDNAFS